MPPNTIYVGRGSKWGNPHKVGVSLARNQDGTYRYMNADDAVDAYRETIMFWIDKEPKKYNIDELRGKDLACWCPLGQPCHADVLLEIAKCL